MTSTIGIPIKLLNEAAVRFPHPTSARAWLTFLGPHHYNRDHIRRSIPWEAHRRSATSPLQVQAQLLTLPAEDNMNVQLKDITVTSRDGRVAHLEQVYIRGSHVRYFVVPDMLRYNI